MAETVDNSTTELIENLFQAIDTITSKRLEKLEFDKTLTCEIIDASNSNLGEYLVSDGSMEFFAYSENSSYNEGTWVYVSVPNGDFNQQKHIVGKYVSDNTEHSTYVNPLDTYLDITGNLIDENKEFGLIANNSEQQEIVLWQIGELSVSPYASNVQTKEEYINKLQEEDSLLYQQWIDSIRAINEYQFETPEAKQEALDELQDSYEKLSKEVQDKIKQAQIDQSISDTTRQLSHFNRLGIYANFKTLLNKYKIKSGNYGLRLDIISLNSGSISSSNKYNYTSMYMDTNTMFGNPYNFVSWSTQQCVFDISEITNIIGMQLVFFHNNNFINEKNKRVPGFQQYQDRSSEEDPLKYTNEWQVYLNMKNILVKDIYISLGYELNDFTEDTILLYTFEPLTYSAYLTDENRLLLKDSELNLNTEEGVAEGLKILNSKNIYLRWVHVDPDTRKTIAIDNIEDIDTWIDEYKQEEFSLAKIHWYRWKMEDGIEDELAGVFWQEVNLNQEFNTDTTPVENDYSWFVWPYFTPNSSMPNEKIKVIIEYPSKDALEYEYNKTLDDHLIEQQTALFDAAIQEVYPEGNYNNQDLLQQTLVNLALEKKIAEEKTNYYTTLVGDGRKLYTSPELEFTNEQEVPNQTTISLIKGLNIVCDNDGLQGVYNIYAPDGQIRNLRDANTQRILSAQFNEVVTKTSSRVQNIRWYIPISQTMIEYPKEGYEYNLNDGITTYAGVYDENCSVPAAMGIEKNGTWFVIERQGIVMNSTEQTIVTGTITHNSLEQTFRIKDYYTQTAGNNTIKCEVFKDNQTYFADTTLYFGSMGGNGTDYTLKVEYQEQLSDGSWVSMANPVFQLARTTPIRLVPHIFDYDNKDITAGKTFSFSFYSQSTTGSGLIINNNGEISKRSSSDTDPSHYYHYIIEVVAYDVVTLPGTPTRTINLTAYCPLTVSFNSNYIAMDGDNRVSYDASGTNPVYYKGRYCLYRKNNQGKLELASNITWDVDLGEELDSDSVAQYYPQISSTTGELFVPIIYIQDNSKTVSLIAKEGNTVVWCQPLYISQDVYSSAFLNSWNGGLNIDEGNNTIMSAMMGAGYKDDNNKFYGVLMGDVQDKTQGGNNLLGTGLFGFHAGEPSFGFNIDGTAFLGKSSGTGQIIFDGNQGYIQSNGFEQGVKGTRLDLSQGTLEMYNALDENKFISLNSSAPTTGYPLEIGNNFSVAWDGTLYATQANIEGSVKATSFSAYNGTELVGYFGNYIYFNALNRSHEMYIGHIPNADKTGILLSSDGGQLFLSSQGIDVNTANSGTKIFTLGGKDLFKVGWCKVYYGSLKKNPIKGCAKTVHRDLTNRNYYTNTNQIISFDPKEYKAIGVLGYNYNKGNSDGGISYLNMYELYLYGQTLYVALRNLSNTAVVTSGGYVTVYLLLVPYNTDWNPIVLPEIEPEETGEEEDPETGA